MSSRADPLLTALVLLILPAAALGAQQRNALMPQWELRADALLMPQPGAQAGAGVNVRAGHYIRLGVAYVAGAVRGPAGDRDARFSQRADATARFLLDPFAEKRRSLYGGAGLTARQEGDGAWKAGLLIVVGMEGAARGRPIPSFEIGLGGGVRAGVVLRGRRRGSLPSR